MPYSTGGGSNPQNGEFRLIRLAMVAALSLAAPPVDEEETAPPRIERIAVELLQITVQQIIIRVPRRDDRVPAMSNMGWRETNGPRCIPARQIAGAMPSASNVDLLMRDNSRVRARLGGRETNGPRCIPARQIAGAMPSASNVDLLMRDNSRVRARLVGRCAALDYYRGLYVDANPDGQLCAGRDAIRSRMGGQCEIVQFRVLRPPARGR